MRRLVFLCSGGGGTLKFIRLCSERGVLGAWEVAGVICDRDCGALDYARSLGLRCERVRYRRDEAGELAGALGGMEPDLIVTTIHKILGPDVVARYRHKLMNLHYSLLPAFKGAIGASTVKQALAAGCRVLGATAHYVSEEVDAGEIVAQSAFAVPGAWPFERCMDVMFRAGCLTLLSGLHAMDAGSGTRRDGVSSLRLGGLTVVLSPELGAGTAVFEGEEVWAKVK